jgi:hypothetical protein
MAQTSSGLGLFTSFMFGFIAGAIVLAALFWKFRHERPAISWVYVALFCFAMMAVAAVQSDQLSFARSALVILIGSGALVAAAQAVAQLERGETIELTTHWGGLGGGIGGWRLSPVTALIIIALALTGSAVGVVLGGKSPPAMVGGKEDKTDKGEKVKNDAAAPSSAGENEKQDAKKPAAK